ncbi:MAG: M15 family metallopeptidase [Clostridia bacterium]|nr:M15 family metallopeptidase [Clostridia bacterium]
MKRKAMWLLLMLMLLTVFGPAQAQADVVYESDMILVNKVYGLPWDYEPSDLTEANVAFAEGVVQSRKLMRADAALALEDMFEAALEDGIELLGVSGYRSYYTQKTIYERRLEEMGEKHVSRYNAKPGHSEHQTGLAMDVGCPGYTDLTERFAKTDAYKWLRENAHLYGFIIRYTKDGEEETGYAFEPWHVRYVGDEATAIWESGLTMEAYVERKLRIASGTDRLPRLYERDE